MDAKADTIEPGRRSSLMMMGPSVLNCVDSAEAAAGPAIEVNKSLGASVLIAREVAMIERHSLHELRCCSTPSKSRCGKVFFMYARPCSRTQRHWVPAETWSALTCSQALDKPRRARVRVDAIVSGSMLVKKVTSSELIRSTSRYHNTSCHLAGSVEKAVPMRVLGLSGGVC